MLWLFGAWVEVFNLFPEVEPEHGDVRCISSQSFSCSPPSKFSGGKMIPDMDTPSLAPVMSIMGCIECPHAPSDHDQ